MDQLWLGSSGFLSSRMFSTSSAAAVVSHRLPPADKDSAANFVTILCTVLCTL